MITRLIGPFYGTLLPIYKLSLKKIGVMHHILYGVMRKIVSLFWKRSLVSTPTQVIRSGFGWKNKMAAFDKSVVFFINFSITI